MKETDNFDFGKGFVQEKRESQGKCLSTIPAYSVFHKLHDIQAVIHRNRVPMKKKNMSIVFTINLFKRFKKRMSWKNITTKTSLFLDAEWTSYVSLNLSKFGMLTLTGFEFRFEGSFKI